MLEQSGYALNGEDRAEQFVTQDLQPLLGRGVGNFALEDVVVGHEISSADGPATRAGAPPSTLGYSTAPSASSAMRTPPW